jgi:hypothetical protein
VDHAQIVSLRGTNRLEFLGIIPCKEDELSAGSESNATTHVSPEWEHLMQAGEAQELASALLRMSEIGIEGLAYSPGVYSKDEVRTQR